MGVVLDPNGNPEAYTWVVQYRSGEAVSEQCEGDQPERTFSSDIHADQVRWLALLPQLKQGPPIQRMRCPPGMRAHFARRRVLDGTIGISGSEHLTATLTGIGWRDAEGNGPTLFFLPDGSSICGIDDATLTEEVLAS